VAGKPTPEDNPANLFILPMLRKRVGRVQKPSITRWEMIRYFMIPTITNRKKSATALSSLALTGAPILLSSLVFLDLVQVREEASAMVDCFFENLWAY